MLPLGHSPGALVGALVGASVGALVGALVTAGATHGKVPVEHETVTELVQHAYCPPGRVLQPDPPHVIHVEAQHFNPVASAMLPVGQLDGGEVGV
mmetsp:Transcript_15803/g.22280  ORF Transcript_15803/g.22280 Transcript_15803/m.22280 type:complete len:95 (-) Transcript_15803:52-336(-)